jgi:hypothetical protein
MTAGIWVGSAADRWDSADSSICSASVSLVNAEAVLTWCSSTARVLEEASVPIDDLFSFLFDTSRER